MTISSLFRAVGSSRCGAVQPVVQSVTRAQPPAQRHPAMSGLDVSPVHGRHCICERCSPDQLAQLRVAS